MLCNSTSLECCTTGGIISGMTRTIYHEDDSVTIVLSEQASKLLDGRVVIHMTKEEHETLEYHARGYEPPAPLHAHELAEMFKDDPELPKYLDEKKKGIKEQQKKSLEDDAELERIYHKHIDKPTREYYQQKNLEHREKLEREIAEVDRLLAFMGRGGSRKIKNFERDLATAKAFPIDQLLDFSRNKLKTQCVWHEDRDPSLHYYRKNNTVWCFACGHGGDAIDVVRQMNNCSLPEAINFINKGRA